MSTKRIVHDRAARAFYPWIQSGPHNGTVGHTVAGNISQRCNPPPSIDIVRRAFELNVPRSNHFAVTLAILLYNVSYMPSVGRYERSILLWRVDEKLLLFVYLADYDCIFESPLRSPISLCRIFSTINAMGLQARANINNVYSIRIESHNCCVQPADHTRVGAFLRMRGWAEVSLGIIRGWEISSQRAQIPNY